MRWCRACGRPIEDHEVVGKRPVVQDRGPIPGHTDRVYRCDVIVTGDNPRTWTPRGSLKAQDA